MRQVTQNVSNAFANNVPFKSGIDKVVVTDNTTQMILHESIIAEKINGELFISHCGYQTNTTKDRLNGIDGVRIQQIKGKWYLNGEFWSGKLIKIK